MKHVRFVIGTLISTLIQTVALVQLPLPCWLLIFVAMIGTHATWAWVIWRATK